MKIIVAMPAKEANICELIQFLSCHFPSNAK